VLKMVCDVLMLSQTTIDTLFSAHWPSIQKICVIQSQISPVTLQCNNNNNNNNNIARSPKHLTYEKYTSEKERRLFGLLLQYDEARNKAVQMSQADSN
jgi:hypothetical protein